MYACAFHCVRQGLGLLINLVEYSARNRHCLVDMEYIVDESCLEDSLVQPADPAESDAASAPPSTADAHGDGAVKPRPSGALAALVQVGTLQFTYFFISVICFNDVF